MRKIDPFSLLKTGSIALLLLAGLSAMAQKPTDIIAANLKAVGGADAFKALDHHVRKGIVKIPAQGLELTFTRSAKRPNFLRHDIEFQGNQIVQAYDGKTTWGINPGSSEATAMPEPLADFFIKTSYYDDFYFGQAEKLGVKLSYEGKVEEEGKSYHHLLVTYKDGKTAHRYYDTQSYLLIKVRQTQPTQAGEIETTTTFSDFRVVEGVKMPFKMESSAGQTVIFTEAEGNGDLDAAIFSMPSN